MLSTKKRRENQDFDQEKKKVNKNLTKKKKTRS